MSPDPHDPASDGGGIHDPGELARLWDALEAIAQRIDERGTDPEASSREGVTPP